MTDREKSKWWKPTQCLPVPKLIVEVQCSDYCGIFYMKAFILPYSKNAPKRQRGRWRWMTISAYGPRRLTPKEWPEKFRFID